MNNSLDFHPTEIWTPGVSHDFERVRDEINRENPDQLVNSLVERIARTESGIVYADLCGDNPDEYSKTDALVLFSTFAAAPTRLTPVSLVKAEVIRRVAKDADVIDENGKLKRVILLANPGIGGSRLSLSKEDRKIIRSGELGPVASRLMQAIAETDIGRVSIFGFSNGADLGLASARGTYSGGLDLQSLTIGDPAGVEDRGYVALGSDFMKAGSASLNEEIEASDIDAQKTAFGKGIMDSARFAGSIPHPDNMAMFRALGRSTFEQRVQEVLDQGKLNGDLVVGYGDSSAIAKPEKIEPALSRLAETNGRDAVFSVKFSGSEHTFGDNMDKLAYLATRASQ